MKNNFLKNYFINFIPEWMTKNISINNKGWFAKQNRMALDYVLNNYKIKNIVELGTYFGSSANYTAQHKNIDTNLYCVDNFDNILLTNYVVDNPTPIDFEYFFKYFKFESFHARLEKYKNIFSMKYDCYQIPKLFYDNKIKVDLFYIDFCKIDSKLIKLVDDIIKLFPDVIIIGDDAVHLDESLKYFEKNYNYIFLESCYLTTKKKLINENILLDKYNKNKFLENIKDYDYIKELNIEYKIKYIIDLIQNTKKNTKANVKNIIEKIIDLKIDPNTQCYYVGLNGNLYHYIGINYYKNNVYYLKLYEELNKYMIDKNIKNDLNLIPNDYFNYVSLKDFS